MMSERTDDAMTLAGAGHDGDGERGGRRFGKVAVVMGGWSAEREVSLMSGQQVFEALSERGIDAHAIDAGRDIGRALLEGRFDRAFLILHGRGGEDGTVQGALDLAGVPYTGSGVAASALSMDKWRAKALCGLAGVPTPEAACVRTLDEARAALTTLGLPLVVKPVAEGSSIGISMLDDEAALPAAFEAARRHGAVLLERRLPGLEVTVGLIGGETLPAVALRAAGDFYDYHAKYVASDTEYLCPAPLPAATLERLDVLARLAFDTLGCAGWARIDFILDHAGNPCFIECNTAPGMTAHSLVPIAARAAGLEFAALCERILEGTLSAGSGSGLGNGNGNGFAPEGSTTASGSLHDAPEALA